MTIELTAEELEVVLLALKEQVRQRLDAGNPTTATDALVARVEQVQRDQRRANP